ncbi:MAG TPA: alpha/beta hydrolase fold domain-containing protein [Gemmatimonadaceae bacterium]|nr:alpha/beta hydrolase fold domain-containing protein [Gemmatimonadaceae bacterium]
MPSSRTPPPAGRPSRCSSPTWPARGRSPSRVRRVQARRRRLRDRQRHAPCPSLVAADLKGLPPVTIINAQIDPLRGDGELLADKLRAAGVDVTQKTYDGVAHEFFGMGAVIDKAKDAEQMAADALKKGWR